MNPSSNHLKGLIITAIGGLTLTVDIPLIKLANGDHWSVLMVRAGATFLAGMIVWSILRLMTPRTPPLIPGRAGMLVATLYGIGGITFIAAVYNTSTANLVFILAFTTMFSALLSWIFLKERPRNATLVAMAAMIVGVSIIVADGLGSGNLAGDFLALLSAFVMASAITVSRHSGREMGFTPLIGVVIPLVVAVVMVGQAGYRIESPWWIILNGAVIIPISFFCLASGPRYLSAPEVAMFYLLETVLAPVWVWLIFNEVPTRNAFIGGSILIAALVAHSIYQIVAGRRSKPIPIVRHPT